MQSIELSPNALLTPHVLWLLFGIIISLVVLMSIILLYHWNTYGFSKPHVLIAEIIYSAGVIVIILAAASSLALFS